MTNGLASLPKKDYQSIYGGYEEKAANNCIYLLANQNIFKPKKLRYLQHISISDHNHVAEISFTYLDNPTPYNPRTMSIPLQ